MSPEQSSPSESPVSYTLFGAGPAYRIEERLGLLEGERRWTGRRVLFAWIVAWLPMAVLAAVQGLALAPNHLDSFLTDFAVNVRFLIVVPAFLLGEAICGEQLRSVVQQFLDAALVKDKARVAFETMVREIVLLSRSGRADAVLLVLAYLHSALALGFVPIELHDSTWRVPVREGHAALSLAGAWYFLVAFPLYSFLLWRWVLRIALWWRFQWKVSKLELQISPSHRDGVGGLAFLSNSVEAFAPFAFASGAMVAAMIADFVVYEGATPLQFQWQIAAFVVVLLILVVGPLLMFIRPLYKAKEEASFQYGAMASRQIQQVEAKWLLKGPEEKDFESSMPDFRAVTHFGHSVSAVRNMSLLPVNKEEVIKLLIAALLPMVPVFASQMPMGEVLSLLLKVLA